jgi:hypothetical protein
MKSLSSVARICWLGCAALSNIVKSEEHKIKVLELDGITTILKSVEQFPTEDEMQVRGDGILCKLLLSDPCRREFLKLGGVEICFKSLKKYMAEPHPNADTPQTGLSRVLNEAFAHGS